MFDHSIISFINFFLSGVVANAKKTVYVLLVKVGSHGRGIIVFKIGYPKSQKELSRYLGGARKPASKSVVWGLGISAPNTLIYKGFLQM